MAQNVRKDANRYVFPMICGPGGWKSRLAKAAGAEPCGQMRNEKFHAAVARSTSGSQNVQKTPVKFSCRKLHSAVARNTFMHVEICQRNTIVLGRF